MGLNTSLAGKSDFSLYSISSARSTLAYLIRSVSEYLPLPTKRFGAHISYSS